MPRTKDIITLDRIPESIDQNGSGRIFRYDLNLPNDVFSVALPPITVGLIYPAKNIE